MLQKLIIYGSGGLGRELLALLRDIDKTKTIWDILGFVDDSAKPNVPVAGLRVLGDINYLIQIDIPVLVLMGFTDPDAKAKVFYKLKQNQLISFPTIVHPLATVEPSANLGEGVIITRFCFVSVDTTLGKCVFFNPGSQVGHDSFVGDFTSVMPSANIAGNVTIGERCLVGAKSAIMQGLSVGSGTTVGIGSIVMQNAPENCTILGYPAKVVKFKKTQPHL